MSIRNNLFGEGPISMSTDDVSETTPAMPASVKSLETFVCKVYAQKSSTRILSELSWELVRAKQILRASNGWSEKGLPIKCLVPSAPRAVVELIKCGCKGECKGNCSCANNGLACTPLCNWLQKT